jgi:signal transduction histidine kinase
MGKRLYTLRKRTASLLISTLFVSGLGCNAPGQKQSANAYLPERLPWRFTLRNIDAVSENMAYRIADLNGDGASELVNICSTLDSLTKTPAHVTLSDLLEERASEQLNFRGMISATCFDWDCDGDQEVFVDEQLDDDVVLRVYDHRGLLLRSIPVITDAPAASDPAWRCTVEPLALIDGNKDGQPDLLIRISTNEAYQPRGLKLLDLQTMKWIWDYPCGTVIESVRIADANRDGEAEIYIKSNAPGNGVGHYINRTDDGHSWFIILSASGHTLHLEPVAGQFSSFLPEPCDMDHDGIFEVALIKMSRNNIAPEKSMIAFWEPVQQRILFQKEYERYLLDRARFLDVDDNSIDELLTFWKDGTIEARNQKNEIIKKIALGEQLRSEPLIIDVDGDGDRELIVASKSRIFAFSQQLELLASFALEFTIIDCADQGKGKPKLIIARSRDARYTLELHPNYAAPIKVAWPGIAAFLAGCALVHILAALRQKRRREAPETWVPQLFYDHTVLGLLALGRSGLVIMINENLKKMLSLDDLPPMPTRLETILAEQKFAALVATVRNCSTAQHPSKLPRHLLEEALPDRDVEVVCRSFRDSRDRLLGMLFIFEDITERTRSNRAAAWASMAQRLAHQIKTPLSSVLLAVQRLQMEYRRDGISKAKIYDRYIDYVAEEVARIRRITDSFLKLSLHEKLVLEAININAMLTGALEKYQPMLTIGLKISTDFAADLPLIFVDEQQMKMVFSIIIENSLDAMGEEGQLTVTTRFVQAIPQEEGKSAVEAVVVECADTGSGIPAESIQKLFNPFFTTKSNGTGLGLPIAKKIVEEHGGAIEIKSQTGIGTVVTIRLPLAAGNPQFTGGNDAV